MATGYRPKIAGTSRGNTWGQQYGSHGNEEATGQMRLGIDFPYVCERCLGSNPYIQMIKSDFGASCKISKRPFHVFKWTNPETRRRMKTVICYEAASVRNCCQACMCDMTFGVPLVIRDALMKASGQTIDKLPESEVGQSFYFNQKDKEAALVAGGALGIATAADPRIKLQKAADQVFNGDQSSSSSSSSSSVKRKSGGTDEENTTVWVAAKQGAAMPSESSIRGALLSFGPIKTISVVDNKGFAFVEFDHRLSAQSAVNSNVQNIAGSDVIVKWSKRKNRSDPSSSSSPSFPSSSFNSGSIKRAKKNDVISAAVKPESWQGPSLAEGFEVPPVPSTFRAFIAPDKTHIPLPVMFPIPTFEQAKRIYPSLKHSRQVN
jgi:hypothetical protein